MGIPEFTCKVGLPPLGQSNITVAHEHYGHQLGPCYGRSTNSREPLTTCLAEILVTDEEIVVEEGVQYLFTKFELFLTDGILTRELVFSKEIFAEQVVQVIN